MKKAGASFHDKVAVVKMYVQRMPVDQIASATSLNVKHVEAIIKRFKDGNKDKISVPERLQYAQEAVADPNQSARIEELEQQNAELSGKLDMILARLEAGSESKAAPKPAQIEVPKAEEPAGEGDDSGEDDGEGQPRRRRRQRVANE